MQLRLPWGRSDESRREVVAPSPRVHTVTVNGEAIAVQIARHRRARRYVLRVKEDGSLRLTVPRGASIAGGLRFAERQSAWIQRERGRRLARRVPWTHGTPVWFRGDAIVIALEGTALRLGAEPLTLTSPEEDVRTAVERHLRALAAAELPVRCLELAARCGHAVARVSVRNQRSRWGACSSRGVITLNWRLIQMPPHVSDYVIFHELMHLRQPNHSRRFWREVESVCPAWREAERWLRKSGRLINGE